MECYVHAYFAGRWQQAYTYDADNIISRTGIFIMYANCPIFWRSSLKTEIDLSTDEAEYTELSSALRKVLPLMTMIQEIDKLSPLLILKPNLV